MRRLLRCLDTHFGLYVEHAHKLLHMQQFLRADGRPLRGDTLQQLAQLFQNILAGDPFALEDGLRLRHLLPGGDISATGCGGLLHGKRIPALFHSKRAFRPRSVNWRARHGFRRSRQERRCRRCSGAALARHGCIKTSATAPREPLPDIRTTFNLEQAERLLVQRALDACQGNKSRAAELLGITREGLRKKLLRLDKTAHGHDGEEA